MRTWLLAAVLATITLPAFPHGGGLNAEGCHTNRKTGDYHCHRAPSVDRSAPKAPPTQPPNRRAAPVAASPEQPTCYVGPRGGTYTITKSGRKNYSGC